MPRRHRAAPASRLFSVLLASCTALSVACDKPAKVAFEPADPVVISGEPVALPAVVVTTKDGARIEPDKPPTIIVDPEDVVVIEDGKLVPKQNGDAKLIASVAGVEPISLDVVVRIVDDVRLTCAQPCSVAVGGRVLVGATSSGFGSKVESDIAWSSSDEKVATVDAKGTVVGVSPGSATIKATSGGKAASIDVVVQPPLDELRLYCPSPAFVVVSSKKTPPTNPPENVACEVAEGFRARLLLEAAQSGTVVKAPGTWSSNAPSNVLVIDGDVSGRAVGAATVDAIVADLKTSMPVRVTNARWERCQDPITFRVPGALRVAIEGATPVSIDRELVCANKDAAQCVSDAAEVVKGAATAPPALVAALADHAANEAVRRCCCARKPQIDVP